ncbi:MULTISPECIES: DUF1456 family protein [Cellvibrio]|uniref:Uncharacterized protein YehS (DUF1456 family) n=1 Tax=Cellvibrio fibrivorans TaxID=126350 RepID=A0ABU1V169_9GAMM|nr:DUF1456 family protein [Cellvibrio fibrivorans]MDR7091196.1 uncharacterized protein YehS (DUF1456 family) [Cellvibrio fibrivorans]
MTNNDILRRLRFIFDFGDAQMMALFASGGFNASRELVSDWLKADDKPDYKELRDVQLAIFLNGLINKKRGKREGEQPEPEKRLNNNIILRKLKIALDFKDEQILEVMELAGFPLSKHELSAFFRKPGHNNYRECQTQVLRNFLKGLQFKMRGSAVDAMEPASE